VLERTGRWRVGDGVDFEFRHYGDESALFDRRSGLTHFVNAAAIEALQILAKEPLANAELTERLLSRCEPPHPEHFDQHVARLLRQLSNLDLIEAVPDGNR
jgi:PqqD family protein of HPr-rel-A system